MFKFKIYIFLIADLGDYYLNSYFIIQNATLKYSYYSFPLSEKVNESSLKERVKFFIMIIM